MKLSIPSIFLVYCLTISLTEGHQSTSNEKVEAKHRGLGRQTFGSSLVNPYYAFNPDYMGGNMPNAPTYQSNPNPTRPSSCTCSCGEVSFGPPVACMSAQTCVAFCLQMYPGQCTIINTYGCCGTSCQYFQSQLLQNRFCSCGCAGQTYLNPIDTCTSAQSCLTRCIANFPQACAPPATQACCGQDCISYSQSIATSCACRCRGSTYYPSPQCLSGEDCVNTCMTTYGDCTVGETQGCCGAICATEIPTCSCNCGTEFRTITSVPCFSSQSCLETCTGSYGACTQENTQACCGNDCRNSFPMCTCMCGDMPYRTLPIACGSGQQCVQACLRSVSQCTITNTYGCCGADCSSFMPTCRCQCGSNVYYPLSICATAEQCTNTCISQYGHVCTPRNTIGCCNGTVCTTRNRFVGVSQTSTIQYSSSLSLFSLSSFVVLTRSFY